MSWSIIFNLKDKSERETLKDASKHQKKKQKSLSFANIANMDIIFLIT